MQAFNTVLATPPTTWTPIPGGPTLYAGNLMWANGNTGSSLSSPDYLQSTVQPQLLAMKALGIQAVVVPVLFPILYEPFYASQTAFQPYLTLYTGVAQAVRAAGLKLIVDNEILFSNDTAAGWTNMNAFYGALTWPAYIAARAQMAANIAQYMQPDYLVLANEPDTEAIQTGQQNLNNPVDAAQMVQAEITAVQNYLQTATVSPTPKLGAGFGSWMALTGNSSLGGYINAYTALPLDYLDFHLLPVNTVGNDNFLTNTLTIASAAAAVGMPVAISQAWLEKETAGEVNNLSIDVVRARGPFDFWAPLDAYFMQMAENLASYTNMLYVGPQFPVFLFAYQPYGGTAANGGAANCTCTAEIPATATTPEIPQTCSDYLIMQNENTLANAADQQSVYTYGAVSYYNQLVTTPDTTPPTVPASLAGTPGFTTASLSWTASSDDIGVAGYNVYRCTPPAAGQPCTGVWLANTTLPAYGDSSLTGGTLYNYQVSAFDFAGNDSPLSDTCFLQTYITSPSAAMNPVATVVSAQEIDLSWSPPSNPTGLASYLVYSGTSLSNLQQIAIRSSSMTTYKDMNLAAGTTYYFGIVAVEQGLYAPMTPPVYATTLPLPAPPSNVTAAPAPTKVVLTWQENLLPNSLPISYYQIFKGTTPGDMINAGSATAATYTASSLTPNTTYYFEIVADDTGHDLSTPSDQIAVTTLPIPAAPANVVAKATSTTQIAVTWSENSPGGMPIQTYTIFRGTSPGNMPQVAIRTTTSFTDTGLSANTTYYYAVQATDTGHDLSPMSATAQVTTPAAPAAPVNVAATANAAARVTVSWSENIPPGGLSIQSYTIYRGTSPANMPQLAVRTTSPFSDSGVSPNTTYYYAITAADTGRDVSSRSATAQVATPPLPAAPVNVAPTANTATRVTVTWSASVPPGGLPIASYTIYRGTSSTGLTKLGVAATTKFVDMGACANSSYYYATTTVDTGGDVSPMSTPAQVATPPLPAAPVNPVATATSATQVTVTWSENIPPNGLPIQYYTIFRGTSPTGLAQVATRAASTFIDTGAAPYTTYYYAIEAVDTGQDVSPLSATVQATTP
jgi:fibronectin type 3 domain-containing protein